MSEEEPSPPWAPEYLEGLRLFNERQFYECHEALEAIWLPLSGGAVHFYQGLIQMAAGFDHATRTGRLGGARHCFEEARKKLARYAPRYGGLDTAGLCERLADLRDLAEAVDRGDAPSAVFDETKFFRLEPG